MYLGIPSAAGATPKCANRYFWGSYILGQLLGVSLWEGSTMVKCKMLTFWKGGRVRSPKSIKIVTLLTFLRKSIKNVSRKGGWVRLAQRIVLTFFTTGGEM